MRSRGRCWRRGARDTHAPCVRVCELPSSYVFPHAQLSSRRVQAGRRCRIVVAFERNSDTGGVKGNATVGATRARPNKRPKSTHSTSGAARWMGGGEDGLASLLKFVRQDFAERCAAFAQGTPVTALPPLCAAEEKIEVSQREAHTHAAWPQSKAVTAANFLQYVQSVGLSGEAYSGQLASVEMLPNREPQLVEVGSVGLSTAVCHAARAVHSHLYSHQAQAVACCLNGVDTVVTTSTASGKSMIYTLVIAETFQREPASTHLLLFPTKALAHDQKQRLVALFEQVWIHAYALSRAYFFSLSYNALQTAGAGAAGWSD